MNIIYKNVEQLKEYEKNPRNNEKAVSKVANSIKAFGFKVPIVVDKDNVIVCGHTRVKAAKTLGIEEVPCIVADDLTEDQIKAFRLADNKTSEFSEWEYDFLEEELAELKDVFDMTDFGFMEKAEVDWNSVEDLTEDNYETPKKEKLRCPCCGHIDDKHRFVKVGEEEVENAVNESSDFLESEE